MPTCRIHEIDEKYQGIECSREAWDQDPEGLCLLHSRQANKDKDGAFTELVKAKLQSEDYGFRVVFFPGPFSLEELTSQYPFTFTKPANFSMATFQEWADFSMATFQGRANFSGATFQKADFFGATFQEAAFSWATFQEEAGFTWAIFQGATRFVEINPRIKGEPPPPVFYGYFQTLRLDEDAFLLFQDTNLSRVQFVGTDLRRVTFHNVTWGTSWGRKVLYDEVLLTRAERAREAYQRLHTPCLAKYLPAEPPENEPQATTPEQYARVEELYRQLKQNYEQEWDFKNAGDFHYGEMEMHRRANPVQLWYQFYWALSGYGEKPLRALIALIIMLLGCTGLFLVLEPNLFGSSFPASLGSAILYVFQKGTLQRPDLPKQAGVAAQVLGAIIPVIIPGQIALFFLALRNRLGRRR